MIVNRRDDYQREVGRLHRQLSEIQFQLANVKLEGKLQTVLDILTNKEADNRITAFERIKMTRRRDTPYVAMLIEISVRRVVNGFDAVRLRLVMLAFVRIKMLPAAPRPLLPQNSSTDPPLRQRRRDIAPGRKQQPNISYESQNADLKHKIKQIEAKFQLFVNDLQKIAPEVVSRSLSPGRKR